MESLILCEGSTDYALLQYYMRAMYGWTDEKNQHDVFKIPNQKSRRLQKNSDKLTIAGMGGCTRIKTCVSLALDRNKKSLQEDVCLKKVVLITDNDDETTEADVIQTVQEAFFENGISLSNIQNNVWTPFSLQNSADDCIDCAFLLLIIPFTEHGAMETFLLDAIAKENPYDAEIIRKGNEFVTNVDSEKRYLKSRRDKTKANYDVYFSIRTPALQFVDRQNILKGIPWEHYPAVANGFDKLKDL